MNSFVTILLDIFRQFSGEQSNELASLNFAAMDVLGTLSNPLMSREDLHEPIRNTLLEFVYPQLSNTTYPFLQGKAAWVFGNYHGLTWANDEIPIKIVQDVMTCMNSEFLSVRIEAALAFRHLAKNKSVKPFVTSWLPEILEVYFTLFDLCQTDELITALQSIVVSYPLEIHAYATQLVSRISQNYLDMLQESLAVEEDILDREDDFDHADLSICKSLGTLQVCITCLPVTLLTHRHWSK